MRHPTTYKLGQTIWTKVKGSVTLFESQELKGYMTEEDLLLLGAVAYTPPQIEKVRKLDEKYYGNSVDAMDFSDQLEDISKVINEIVKTQDKLIRVVNALSAQKEGT
jgi:hypothetical protein